MARIVHSHRHHLDDSWTDALYRAGVVVLVIALAAALYVAFMSHAAGTLESTYSLMPLPLPPMLPIIPIT